MTNISKTFLATFLAILAAAAVIVAGLAGWTRLDNWHRGRQWCSYQVTAIGEAAKQTTDSYTADARSRAATASDPQDVAAVGRSGAAAVEAAQNALTRTIDLERQWIALLEHKPFGLPLTADERKELDSLKADLSKQ